MRQVEMAPKLLWGNLEAIYLKPAEMAVSSPEPQCVLGNLWTFHEQNLHTQFVQTQLSSAQGPVESIVWLSVSTRSIALLLLTITCLPQHLRNLFLCFSF